MKFRGKSVKAIIPVVFFVNFVLVGVLWGRESAQTIFERKCGTCHNLKRIRSKKKSKNHWMRRVGKCAKRTENWEDETKWISDKDTKIIIKYLISTQLLEKKKRASRRGASRGKQKPDINVIKTAADPENLSTTEKIHVPFIIVPRIVFARERFEVAIKVGKRTHPMVETHYIRWVELYQDGILVKKFKLKPGLETKVTATVSIGNLTDLRVVASCTVHGLWETKTQVKAR